MTGLEIGILLVGVALFAGSFFVTRKLSASDIDELKHLSEAEIKALVEAELKKASTDIDTKIEEKKEKALENFDRASDKDTNEKIMEISEYSDTVLDAMNKSHDEVMFMYSMMNEKQEKLTKMTKEMQEMESTLRYMKQGIEEKLKNLEEKNMAVKIPSTKELDEEIQKVAKPSEMVVSMQEELKKKLKSEEIVSKAAKKSAENANAAILDLHKQGFSEIEIAKKLGKGLGEVKLVLGLFHN